MASLKNKAKKTIKKMLPSNKKDLETFYDLFLVQMKDLYDTEHQITKALPKIIKNASSAQLKKALSNHLKETEEHVKRLEKIYGMLDMKPKRQTSKGMKGLLDDGKEVMSMKAEPELMDAAITANARHVEHQEMAGYLATIAWAKLLGLAEAADLMKQTLTEEEEADKKLATLADESINKKAASLVV